MLKHRSIHTTLQLKLPTSAHTLLSFINLLLSGVFLLLNHPVLPLPHPRRIILLLMMLTLLVCENKAMTREDFFWKVFRQLDVIILCDKLVEQTYSEAVGD